MKRLLIAITTLLLAITASAQSPYSYKYGKLYHEETMLTKKNAADFLTQEEAKLYKAARNMFISCSVLTYMGCTVGPVVCGLMVASSVSKNIADNTIGLTLSTAVAISGAIGVLIGAPLMIVGACKAKDWGVIKLNF